MIYHLIWIIVMGAIVFLWWWTYDIQTTEIHTFKRSKPLTKGQLDFMAYSNGTLAAIGLLWLLLGTTGLISWLMSFIKII